MRRVVLFALSILIVTACNEKKEIDGGKNVNQGITKVKTVKVSEKSSSNILNYSGVIIPEVNIPLSFLVSGKITKIYVDEGDFVKKGQPVAEIDNSSYKDSYNAALAVKNQAQDAYDRLKPVYEKGTLPEIKWVEVLSKLNQAKASLNIAQKKLNDCTLKAPSSGIIGRKFYEAGTNITPVNTVFDLVSINKVYAKISVSEDEISMFTKGQVADIKVSALNTGDYQGIVKKIGVMANPVSRTYDVKILINNNNLEIKPGMVCDVNIDVQHNNSCYVPYGCVSKDKNGNAYVYKVDTKTNTIKKQQVTTGNFLNNSIQIISGLTENDVVVLSGQHKLTDNQKVIL
jgi:RND family efflux transporter MFP subunit